MTRIDFRKNKVLMLVLALLMSIALLSGCGTKKEEAAPATSKEASGTEEKTSEAEESEYNNSYSEGGVPSAKLTELREKGTLIAGSSGDAPFAYIDQATGEFSGVDAEIIKEVAKRLGIEKVEMALIPFSELILNLNSDNIDIITDCMYIRQDRAKKVYFGEIWYTQGGGLLVSQDSGISSIEDFDPSSSIIGYTPGTVWQTLVDGWQAEGLIKESRATGDQSESIVALQNGKIDGFLTDSTVLENLFANFPDTVDGLKMAENYEDTADAIGRIAAAVNFDDIAFMKEVDTVVAELREEGFIAKVFEDYKLNPDLHMITNDERTHDVNTRTE
ncbi:MAG: transporter substrate-binding domain-containing protein [Lachnospiraceae bacterium]|nr:transporter substrate-binding domain-containing protein [Lachnospiraceae bacterium]